MLKQNLIQTFKLHLAVPKSAFLITSPSTNYLRPKRNLVVFEFIRFTKCLISIKYQLINSLFYRQWLQGLSMINLSSCVITNKMVSYLSIWIDSKPIVWDFSWYVSDINSIRLTTARIFTYQSMPLV